VIVKYLLKVAMLGSAWVMYVLIGLSVASIAVMVERFLFFRKHGRGGEDLADALCDLLERGDREAAEGLLRRHPAIEAEVLLASLRWSSGGPEGLSAGIDGEMIKRRRDLEAGMTLLGTLGNNAPFIGLFGTVIGVIVAFADLAEGSSKIQMDKVMGGIAEALIATGVGLFVAIPAVVAYNVYQKKITDIEDNVSSINKRLCALLAVVGTFGETPPPGPVAESVAADDLEDEVTGSSSPQLADVPDAEE
jgi:biopolymer transport protein ExbB/biopolymer transport protein TolQ